MNEILLRRKLKVIVDDNKVSMFDNSAYVATMMKNIESLGYTFSSELFKELSCYSVEDLYDFYLELVSLLKEYVGANIKYRPMYPNFPESVMERDNAELYINAIVHYWSDGTLYPVEEKNERIPLFDVTKVKVIDAGTEDDLKDIFYNLCGSKTSLSLVDKQDLVWFLNNTDYKLPDEIPYKENVAVITRQYLDTHLLAKATDIQKYFKTATDVLRLITALSDGDISLADNTKYKSMKRRYRTIAMDLLENCKNIEEDMVRYMEQWKRVGERLHPWEFKQKKYPKTLEAFRKIRKDIKIYTYGGKLETGLLDIEHVDVLSLLKQRPGEFARRLDHVLRISPNKNLVVNSFREVANKISTPVLLQVREHFLHRYEHHDIRVFFPKGNLARAYYIPNTLPDIDDKYCKAIIKICESALIEQYSAKEFMGNVYLSNEYRNYVVPFSQRSASKSLKTVVRGSRFQIPNNVKTLRGFIWWTNTEQGNRIDIDLSATFYGENWDYLEHISYTNLKSNRFQAFHSGDITNGGPVDGDGASEFLDIDIDAAVENGARYVVYQVYLYSGTDKGFAGLPHAMFGWMNREDPGSGEIYEPKTVEQKMDLTTESYVNIPVIFDCVAGEVIWCDMSINMGSTHHFYGGNNLESNLDTATATCYSMVNMRKPNLYDLVDLNIRARGIRVDDKDDADIVFDVDDGVTPFDTEVFMGEYL